MGQYADATVLFKAACEIDQSNRGDIEQRDRGMRLDYYLA